jgi:ABC-type polysaccharide/polyol phosphate export permease
MSRSGSQLQGTAGMDTPRAAAPTTAQLLQAAGREWRSALRLHTLWINFALEDLRDRYRRTSIGLAWIVLSFALFVAVKVTIFGRLSSVTGTEFGLFVALGFGAWTFISAMVIDACTAYLHARPWMLGTAVPYPVYLLQATFRNWLTFSLILAVLVPALAWKPTPWATAMLWSVPGLAAYLLTSVWLAAILAPLCVRFRDLHHAVQTFMRLLFFATPILWLPSMDPSLAAIARWNPATHYISLLREPLLYNTFPAESWAVVAAINLIGLPLGLLVYARTRREVIFWV